MHKNAFVCSARTVFAKCFAACAISLACVVGLAGGAGFAYADEPQKTPEEILSSEDNAVNQTQVPDSSFLYDTSIDALASADVFYDNTTVVVTGEVVGDRRSAGIGSDSSWITLYSLKKGAAEQYNPSSIEVCVSNSLADTIDTYGRYGVRGTYVQVSGTYHLACADHDGLSDMHADSLSIVRKGAQQSNPFDVTMFLPGVIAVLAGLLVMFVHKRITDKAR